MKLHFTIPSILLLILVGYPCHGENAERIFYDAVRAEASGDLKLAISLYEQLSQNQHSANLHSNLANLYFKVEDYGRAVLHFRKSLLIDPDNREATSNLAFALEMSGVSNDTIHEENPAFSATALSIWALLSSAVLWGGLLFFIRLSKSNLLSSKSISFCFLWLGLLSFLGWGWMKSRNNSEFLKREIIVLDNQSAKKNSSIPLRRFAGEGSDHNTLIKPGTSLFVDLDEYGNHRLHTGPDGSAWYLVRSHNGSDKGWLKSNEFAKLLSP